MNQITIESQNRRPSSRIHCSYLSKICHTLSYGDFSQINPHDHLSQHVNAMSHVLIHSGIE